MNDLYIGLDVGGSKTELQAWTPSRSAQATRCLRGPGANLRRAGAEETVRVLSRLVGRALEQHAPARLRSLCAGVAGAASTAARRKLAGQLRHALGPDVSGACLNFVDDARIALEAAFEGESGVVVGAGTGSVVRARTASGRLVQGGGWGCVLGDQGSGYALGRAGLRAVAAACDGGPPTHLRALLAEKHGLRTREELLHYVHEASRPLQELAPAVLQAAEAGDAVAARLLEQETTELAEQVSWLAEEHAPIAKRIKLFGGLTNAPVYVEALRQALRHVLPDWKSAVASAAPAAGALRMARRAAPATRRADATRDATRRADAAAAARETPRPRVATPQ